MPIAIRSVLSFKKGVISTLSGKGLAAVLGLLMVVLVSRAFGAEGRGHIGLFMSSVALLQLFCDFGNSSAIINLSYVIPQRNLRRSSLIWVAFVCGFSYLFLVFFPQLPYVWLIPPAAFLYSLVNLQQMLLMGQRKVHLRNISLLIQPLLIIPFFLIMKEGVAAGTDAYPSALFPALLISAMAGALMLGRLPAGPQKRPLFETDILKQGAWVQGAQVLQFLNYRLNFFLLAWLAGEAALGIYNNAVILCESVWILGHSLGQMLHMKVLNTRDEKEHLKMTDRLIRINLAGSATLLIPLYLLPGEFWTLLFSSEFSSIRSLFPLLFPGVLFFSVSNIINHLMHARGFFQQILFCNLFGLLTGLAAAVILIPLYGIGGACLSWSAGLGASMLSYLFRYKIIAADIRRKP